MNKKLKKFLIVYLSVGVIWATLFKFPFGIMLEGYEGIQPYANDITAVTQSYLTDSGNLVLCLQGRLSNSERYPTAITDFSLVIPIKSIYSKKSYVSEMIDAEYPESNFLTLSDKLISKECVTPKNVINVQVKKADYTPRKAYHFYSERHLVGVKPDNDKEYMVYVVPTANEYPEWHFMERVDLYIVNKNADVYGREHYIIGLRRSQFDRGIGFHEYAIAFAKDALFYPFAIIMMGMWGH